MDSIKEGSKRTVEKVHGEEDQHIEADNPTNGNAKANPDPEAVMSEAVLGQDGIHERGARLAGSWLLPPSCAAHHIGEGAAILTMTLASTDHHNCYCRE